MEARPKHLAYSFFKSLRRNISQIQMVDYGLGKPKSFSKRKIILLAIKLAQYLKRNCTGQMRIGVVLPSGVGGVVANLAVFFSGKIPVNLNFSLGSEIARQLIEKADIKTIITAEKMMDKFPDFPWTQEIVEVSSWFKKLAEAPYRLFLEVILLSFPFSLSRLFLQIPKFASQKEAVLLFTSGSSGEPKGVILTHENIISNCEQIKELDLFDSNAKLLANLPLFHSFGFTVATCFPLLHGVSFVSVPSPLDVKLGLQAIRREKITFLLGTPTFLRGFLSKGKKEDVKSLRYVVAGAEKSAESFKNKWEDFANCCYLEGYGLTETSPGISFNLPGSGRLPNSVGRLFKGIECKTINPDTRLNLPQGEIGLLCFRGPNIFHGYLDEDKKTKEVITDDGWFITGDLGYVNEAGFLFIEGRLSRFSKIGGEMVPHVTVEDAIRKIISNEQDNEIQLVILGKPDETKGEQLILVVEQKIDFPNLRKKLTESGLPNLWIPKRFIEISEIPILPTGKVDFQGLNKMIS